jgi:hypothetical protein
MPDTPGTPKIMCGNNECPKRHDCYRYVSTPNMFFQIYYPFESNENGCQSFLNKPISTE